MAAQILEVWRSREGSESLDNPAAVLLYVVTGTTDEVVVRALVDATAPATYLGLQLAEYTLRPLGNGIWEIEARYGIKPQTGESTFTFDTTGGTAHIGQSLATIASYAPPGQTAPDCQGAIGVNGDAVEGTDITIAQYNFTETHFLADAAIDAAYKATLFALTGKVNDATFKGFAAGEVLFLGATGSKRGNEDWELNFRFAAQPNATGLTVGTIVSIAKKGWEHLWVMYRDSADQDQLIKRPVAAYVERVYLAGDFSLLGIGT